MGFSYLFNTSNLTSGRTCRHACSAMMLMLMPNVASEVTLGPSSRFLLPECAFDCACYFQNGLSPFARTCHSLLESLVRCRSTQSFPYLSRVEGGRMRPLRSQSCPSSDASCNSTTSNLLCSFFRVYRQASPRGRLNSLTPSRPGFVPSHNVVSKEMRAARLSERALSISRV